jgi:hypothetical protein
MAEQSSFSKYPKKQLYFISTKLIDDGFEWDNIDYYSSFDDNYEKLKIISRYFDDSNLQEQDVQFFIKFIEENIELIQQISSNSDRELIDKLIIPQANDYLIEYTLEGSCTFIEYYNQKFSSYDRHWVRDAINIHYNDGNFDWYDGTLLNTQYDNFEFNNWEIENVKEISGVQESRNRKRLLENTEKLIPKLDEKTLVTLKYLIDKQLRNI